MKLCSCNCAQCCRDVWRLDIIMCCVNPTFELPINLFLILPYHFRYMHAVGDPDKIILSPPHVDGFGSSTIIVTISKALTTK